MSWPTTAAKSLANYPWPALPESTQPDRNGNERVRVEADEPRRTVLTYEKTESHWSEELTVIHEVGNGDHPIDRASRALALRSLCRYLPGVQALSWTWAVPRDFSCAISATICPIFRP